MAPNSIRIDYDRSAIRGIATFTTNPLEFYENEPADDLKKGAVYILQPQIPVPKVMHIHGKEITSWRFTAIEVIGGTYKKCVRIKATSFMHNGTFNGVPFHNRDFVHANMYKPKSSSLRIVSPVAIEYLGLGTYYDQWLKREQYCEAFKSYPDKEGYCQMFSLADLCPELKEYLL